MGLLIFALCYWLLMVVFWFFTIATWRRDDDRVRTVPRRR